MPLVFENIKNRGNDATQIEKEGHAIFLLEVIKNILFEYSLNKGMNYLLTDLEEILKKIATEYSFQSNLSNSVFFSRPIHHIKYESINNSVFEHPESYESREFQFLFGLSAYLDNLDLKMDNLEEIKETVKSLIPGIARDLEDYAKIYQLMCESKVIRFWNWDSLYESSLKKIKDFSDYQPINYYLLKLMSDIPEGFFNNSDIEKWDWNILSIFSKFFSSLKVFSLKDLNIDEDKGNMIYNFLKQVSEYQSKTKIEKLTKIDIDRDKIQDFIQNFQKTFLDNDRSYMRTLFKYNEKIQYKDKKGEASPIIFRMNELNKKIDFISNTHPISSSKPFPLNMSSLSLYFSGGFTKRENEFIQSEILKKCKKTEVSYDRFKEVLINKEWKSNEVLILNTTIYNRIIMDPSFHNSLKGYNSKEKTFFRSYFQFKNKKVPFVSFYIHEKNTDSIIFDISKLPTLEIFDPVDQEKELLRFEFLKDIGISIGIDAFSHNKKLMECMIKNPPKWLTEKGDEKAQREYLCQMVSIKILQGLYLNWQGVEQIGEYFVIKD